MEEIEVERKEKGISGKQNKDKDKRKVTHDCEEGDDSENKDKVKVNADIQDKSGNVIPLTSGDVTEQSGSRQKKKKAKKHQHKHENDLATEKMGNESKENEVNADVKDQPGNVIPSNSSDVTEQLGCRAERKKAKKHKHKHENDLATEKIGVETESKGKEVNADVKDQTGNVILPNSSDVTEPSGSREERKKAKKHKHKHESELATEKIGDESKEIEVNADVKDQKGNVIPPNNSDVTEQLGSRAERKKAKKHKYKHENDLATEKIGDETESKGKEVNADVKDHTGNVIPPSSGDVTEQSGSREKRKKAKKHRHKHETELAIEKMGDETESKEKEINANVKDQTDNVMLPNNSDATEQLGSREERKKAKKHKHENDLATEKIGNETESKGKEVNADVKDQAGNVILPNSSDVTEPSGSREERKKANKHKHKHENELATEKFGDESKENKVNADVTEQLGSRAERKKAKKHKHKHENDLATEKIGDETESKGKEVNADVKDHTGNVIPPSSGDVTEQSGSREKRKKAKKHRHKHETELAIEKMGDETESKEKEINANVKDQTDNVILPNNSDATEQLGSREERKKAKKHKHENDLATEKIGNETESKGKEVNADVKDQAGNVILPNSSDVTEPSGSREERKKANKHKHKHENELATEKFGDESKENEVNADVKDQTGNVIPPNSSDVTEQLGSRAERKKAKKHKHKHENDLATEKIGDETESKGKEVNADVKDQTGNVIPPNSSDVTEQSGSREKRKKAKKHRHKHETELAIEKMGDETESKEKEINADVKDQTGNVILPNSSDVTEQLGSREERKKAKKHRHKHETELAIEKMGDETESKEKEINADVKDQTGNVILPNSSDVTEQLGSREERKKAKKHKHKHENDLATEKIGNETESKGKEVNADVKDQSDKVIPPNSGDVTEQSGSHEKKIKAKKWKQESDLPAGYSESTKDKEKEANADEKDEVGNDMSSSNDDATQEMSGCTKRKKSKKQKREKLFVNKKMKHGTEGKGKEVNTDGRDKLVNMPGDVTEELGDGEKRKKGKKRKHESNIVTKEPEDKEKEVNDDVKDKIGSDMPSSSGDITDESGGRKERKKSKKHKHEIVFVTEKMEDETQGKEKEVSDKIENVKIKSEDASPLGTAQEPTKSSYDAKSTEEMITKTTGTSDDVDKALEKEGKKKLCFFGP